MNFTRQLIIVCVVDPLEIRVAMPLSYPAISYWVSLRELCHECEDPISKCRLRKLAPFFIGSLLAMMAILLWHCSLSEQNIMLNKC